MTARKNALEPHRLGSPPLGTVPALALPAGGLRLLLEAFECASELGEDAWEFAVETRCLAAAGLTNTQLRWLLHRGYALQGIERTRPQAWRRSFRHKVNLSISEAACFVLTEAGAAYARRGVERASLREAQEAPLWGTTGAPQQTAPAAAIPIELNAFVTGYRELQGPGRAGPGRQRASVPLARLRRLGVENEVLLRMMYHAHVGNTGQSRGDGAVLPRPCPISSVCIVPGCRFFLTDAGVAFAAWFLGPRRAAAEEDTLSEARETLLHGRIAPRYDREHRTLSWGAHVLKRFRQVPGNQELILETAEELHWPAWFDDPLPRRAGKNPKVVLHDTIRDLNRRQSPYLIHFKGDGTGTRVGWEYR